MRTAKTGNGFNGMEHTAETGTSEDVSDIVFSFDGSQESKAIENTTSVPSAKSRPTHKKAITAKVIDRLTAFDSEGSGLLATQNLSPCLDRMTHKELLRRTIDGDTLQHASGFDKQTDLLDDMGIGTVEIKRTLKEPLGFFIRQGDGWRKQDGIFVSRILLGSVVDCSGVLKIGDEILEINRVSVRGYTLHQVVQLIQIPKRLILTLRMTNKFRNPKPKISNRHSAPDLLSGVKKDYKLVYGARNESSNSRAENYKQIITPGSAETNTRQRHVYDHNSNANEVNSYELSKSTSTVDDLIKELRAHNKGNDLDKERSKALKEKYDTRANNENETSGVERTKTESQTSAPSIFEAHIHPFSQSLPHPHTKILLHKRGSTITPVTTVNLIFDDEDIMPAPTDLPHNYPVSKPIIHPYRREPIAMSSGDNKSEVPNPTSSLPNSRANSPGSSPKGRRRLPSVPTEADATLRASQHSSKKLLSVPGKTEGRSHRKLPTPPPSPLLDRKLLAPPSLLSTDLESNYSQSPESDKSAGFSFGQHFETASKSSQSDIQLKGQETEKTRGDGDKNDSGSGRAQRPMPFRRAQTQYADFFEQQRYSMLLQSYAYRKMQATSSARTASGTISHGESSGIVDVQSKQESSLPMKNSESVATDKHEARLVDDVSPAFLRRASSSALFHRGFANQTASQSLSDSCQIKVEPQSGFRVYPDDYQSEDLKTSHAMSGMVQVRLIKATHLPAPEKKLDKKKKMYCAIEVDFERKAFTTSRKRTKNLTWDEAFEVEIQHGREMCFICCTSNQEFDKPVARTSFYLAPLVRRGKAHQVIFRLQPDGLLHAELEFTELKTLLKRVQSTKKTGVFGFRLTVTSELGQANVPLLVRKCVQEIEKRGLDSVGLYRISGNARRKKELRAQFEENTSAVDIAEENCPDINVITGILKDYLRELPEPLITEKMSEALINAVQGNMQEKEPGAQKSFLSELLSELPGTNRDTLVFILKHLGHVMSRKDENKMDARNLSVCLSPVLQCSPTNLYESKDLLDLKFYLKTVEILLQIWQNVDGVT